MEVDLKSQIIKLALMKRKQYKLSIINIKLIRCTLMMSCWNSSPVERPTFNELFQSIDELIKPLAGYIDLFISSKH